MSFEEKADYVFQQLCEKFGNIQDFNQQKNDLLYVYKNEKSWRSAELLRLLKPKHWRLDENGEIQQVKI